jgi:hypothetical protein
MIDDLTTRLIAHNSCGCGCSSDTRRLIGEAADEIERLRALITEWVDANVWYYTTDDVSNAPAERVKAAEDALLKETGR